MFRRISPSLLSASSAPKASAVPLLVAEAQAALASANIGGALSLLDRAKQADPFAPSVDLLRGMCFAHRGDPFSARQCVLEELRHNPHNATARHLAASLRKKMTQSFLALDPAVADSEPVFAMAYDALLDHTMLDAERLFSLYLNTREAVEMAYASSSSPPAAGLRTRPLVVECGTAGGGSVTLMGIAAMEAYDSIVQARHQEQRKATSSSSLELPPPPRIIAADTFRGMPKPTEKDAFVAHQRGAAAVDAASSHWADGTCSGSEEQVRQLARSFSVDVETIAGLFADTLPSLLRRRPQHDDADEHELVMLHIDCDWYESTRDALKIMWPELAPGGRGRFQIDDFLYWEGCQKATQEFFSALKSPPKCSTASVALCGCTS